MKTTYKFRCSVSDSRNGGIYASDTQGPQYGPQIQIKNQGQDEEESRQEKEEVVFRSESSDDIGGWLKMPSSSLD
jgi:hypothetical protein